MSNIVQNAKENTVSLYNKMKETWSKLTDENIKLYEGQREQFFAKLKELHNVSKEDAQKAIKGFEAARASADTEKAA